MTGHFYKLGVDLALHETGLLKFALGLGELAQAAAKSALMQETREVIGFAPPDWKPTLPMSTAVDKAKDIIELLKEKMKPGVSTALAALEAPGG